VGSSDPLRVAFVDDDDDLRAMVALSLRLQGCETLGCSSADEALRYVPVFHPHAIVLDFMMPGMDGLQTLKALSRRMDLRDTKVVITSAANLPEQRCLEQGAAAVLPKPFDALQLGGYLAALCGR
jgi:CheY-like chemotaxis protein